MKRIPRIACGLVVALVALAPACGGGGGNGDGFEDFDPALAAAAIATYADLMHANYSDVVTLAEALQQAIANFVGDPTEPNLAAARAAYVAARPYYQQTEIGRFYDGPIDDADGPEGELNAWPLDEAYIDYVIGNPNAGIINSMDTIDETTLRSLNEAGGEANISIGWHAIEFLLWGQDTDPNGPGARPATDYDDMSGASNQDRRREYLTLCAQMLVDDLKRVRDDWAPGNPTNYRAAFLASDPAVALGKILTGLGSLGAAELAQERIAVPLDSAAQEDEHSCFSDQTHLDHLHDVIGIRNAWLGQYRDSTNTLVVNGTSLKSLAESISPARAEAMDDSINDSIAKLNMQQIPFDQAIINPAGRQILLEAITLLSVDFNEAITRVAEALDVEILTELQD